MPWDEIKDIVTSTVADLLAALVIAATAYVLRTKILRLFRASTLRSRNQSPSLSLEIDSVKNEHDEWVTIFVVENTGDIEISDLRVFLCSHNSSAESLVIKKIKIDEQRKWINDGGQRLQLNTRSLHEGCNVTEDERYFVEFVDDIDGTIFRMSRGVPSAKDGTMPFYGTVVCRKRLPRKGLTATGRDTIKKKSAKYDVDLAVG